MLMGYRYELRTLLLSFYKTKPVMVMKGSAKVDDLERELIEAAKAETNHYDNGWGGSAWEDECRQRLQKLRTICRALISLEGESLEGE